MASLPCLEKDYATSFVFAQDGHHLVWVADKEHLGTFDIPKARQFLTATDKRCRPQRDFVINHAGTEFVSGSTEASLCVWNIANGALTRVLLNPRPKPGARKPLSMPNPTAFTPNDRGLVVSELFGPVSLWNTKTGHRVPFPDVKGHKAPRGNSLIPEGIAAADGSLVLIDRRPDAAWIIEPNLHVRAVPLNLMEDSQLEVVSVSENAKLVALGWPLQVLSLETGDQLATIEATEGVFLQNVLMFHPSDPMLFALGPTGPRAWNTETGEAASGSRPAAEEVHYLEFSPDGQSLLVGIGNSLRRWDLSSGMPGPTVASTTSVNDASLVEINLATPDGFVQIGRWNRWATKPGAAGANAPVCDNLKGESQTLAASKQAGLLAVARPEHVVLCDLATGHVKRTLDETTKGMTTLAVSPSGQQLALASAGAPFLLDLTRNKRVELVNATVSDKLAFLSDRRLVASDRGTPHVRIWDSSSGKEVAGFDVTKDKSVSVLATSPDGERIATSGDGPDVSVWNSAGALQANLRAPALPTRLAFGPDGRHLAIGSAGMVTVYDVSSRQRVLDLAQTVSPEGAFVFAEPQKLQVFGDSSLAERYLRCHVGPENVPINVCQTRMQADSLLCPLVAHR